MSRAVLLLACSTTLMGCILRDFDYEEPANVPPSVLGTVDDPLDRVQILDLDAVVGGDGGVGSELEFVATVRDPNVAEPLQALIFVDRDEDPTPIRSESLIPPEQDEDPVHRRFRFTVPRAEFASSERQCHHVELHVSGGFVDFSNPRPAIDGDLGVGVWWIATRDESRPVADMNDCATMGAL